MVSKSTLHPGPAGPALALRLNPEVLQMLSRTLDASFKPKLVVKDGLFVCTLQAHLGLLLSKIAQVKDCEILQPTRIKKNSYDLLGYKNFDKFALGSPLSTDFLY